MSLVQYMTKNYPDLIRRVLSVPTIQKFVASRKINYYANLTTPRPRPFSLVADYTSWISLTDKEYTGRHLPADEVARNYPDLREAAQLWQRKEGQENKSFDTSMLFSFFAQWFTDSFLRTNIWDTRKNISNHQIDFCMIYGSSEDKAHILRAHHGGKLAYQMIDGEIYPPYLFDQAKTTHDNWVFASPELAKLHSEQRLKFIFPKGADAEDRLRHMFATGLEHGNSHIGYTLLNIIALREHNRIADELARANPSWDDERLFQTARLISMVIWLKVVLGDYIGHIASVDVNFLPEIGFAEDQKWYRENWIALEFDLLYRWHSMVPEELKVGTEVLTPEDYRSNPQRIFELGVENLIDAASRQYAGKIGLKNTPRFFCEPMGANGDQPSIQERTLKMARDANLRPYNEYRVAFGLAPLASFDELTDDPDLARQLGELYGNIDNLEWMVGIFAEKHPDGMMMGELMTNMVAYDAFTHALTNPLFSKNIYNEETFSKAGLAIINGTDGIQDIVARNTKTGQTPLASFKAVREVPGSYGLPVLRQVMALAELRVFGGWTEFFERRARRANASVFKTSFIEPVTVILDPKGHDIFNNWDDRMQKEWRFGFAKPPKTLTGGKTKPLVFQNDPEHIELKAIIMDLLRMRASQFEPMFHEVLNEYADRWVARGQVSLTDELEKLSADFAMRWMFDVKFDPVKTRLVYNNIFYHHFKFITQFNPRSTYSRSRRIQAQLVDAIRASDVFTRMKERAQSQINISEEALLHQLLFITGMNMNLSLQNICRSLVGELENNPHEVKKLREAVATGEVYQQRLDAFVNETLRLHPPVFFLTGRANRDFVLHSDTGNFQIRKDEQLVGVMPFAQRQWAKTSNPDEFEPERFNRPNPPALVWSHGLDDQPPTPNNHVCLGKNFGLRFAKMFLAAMVENYEWRLETAATWDMNNYSLHAAAPIGPLRTKYFARRRPTSDGHSYAGVNPKVTQVDSKSRTFANGSSESGQG